MSDDARTLGEWRAHAEKFEAVASAWKNVAAQCAQALATVALDERLDPETREALRRTYHSARSAHGL